MFGKTKKHIETAELVSGCQEQKSWAQKALYSRYSAQMLGLCFRYVKDKMEAESVMVQGFVKVFQKINQYQGGGSFEGWMKRIMVNESLQYLRKNKYLYVEVEIEQADYEVNFDQIDQRLHAEDIVNLIGELPVGYRTVFNLYAIEGYSHQEIAEQLGISENTSKSQLSRARALLQKKLKEIDVEGSKIQSL